VRKGVSARIGGGFHVRSDLMLAVSVSQTQRQQREERRRWWRKGGGGGELTGIPPLAMSKPYGVFPPACAARSWVRGAGGSEPPL